MGMEPQGPSHPGHRAPGIIGKGCRSFPPPDDPLPARSHLSMDNSMDELRCGENSGNEQLHKLGDQAKAEYYVRA